EPVEIEVGSVVRSAGWMLRRLLGSAIELRIEESSVNSVRADSLQLEQVIVNLAVNARDAMPTGGKLVVAIDDVSVACGGDVPPGDYVLLQVTDTGWGM